MMRLGKRLAMLGLLGLLILGLGMLAKTVLTPSRQLQIAPAPPCALPEQAILARLGAALRFETVSYQDPKQVDQEAFRAFQRFLEESYPLVYRCCSVEEVGGLSLLIHWRGSDSALAPVLLLAHQDVVPVPDPESWRYPPFSGADAEGCIWGRGALDDKSNVLGQLEAMEWLLSQGFQPRRSIYLALGHDEEVGGAQGADVMGRLLASRGVRALFSLDEGGGLLEGVMPGVEPPVALISLSEKGYLTLELSVVGAGGHSSQPPSETTIGILSRALLALEENPFPARLRAPVDLMFRWLAPEAAFPFRLVLSNLWLTQPLLTSILAQKKDTASTVRSTTAVTVFTAGEKENVLAAQARALVNFRLMPGDSIAHISQSVREIIDDDRVQLRVLRAQEASPIASVDSAGFRIVQETIGAVFPESVVAPAMTLAGTDSKHYTQVTDTVLRFCPLRFNKASLKQIHGKDERIGKADYVRAVQFFARLIERAAG